MRSEAEDFEFERRFLVEEIPPALIAQQNPNVIVQTYFLAEDGYALRVRLQATNCPTPLPLSSKGKQPLELFEDLFDLCVLTVKGPTIGGTRYEAEREIDKGIGLEMCLRGGSTLSKRRYGVWVDEDGWVLDQFTGENAPLIIAECERTSPVVDLAIPSFCVAEVTNDVRFSNDSLTSRPYSEWADAPNVGQQRRRYLQEFGKNTASSI